MGERVGSETHVPGSVCISRGSCVGPCIVESKTYLRLCGSKDLHRMMFDMGCSVRNQEESFCKKSQGRKSRQDGESVSLSDSYVRLV